MISNPSQPSLLIDQVTKTFRRGAQSVMALRHISLKVEPGEFVAVMGASGSGKSTLLHAIAGLTEIDLGSIVVGGQDLTSLSDKALTRFRQKQIGLVFQAFNLIPSLNAEDNVRLPVRITSQLESQVDDLFSTLGISDRRQHKPGALSGGEQQRVAIARALVSDPAIMLADEPTGSLDSESGQQICRLLRTLSETHRRTIIVVTHEPSVAIWADRVVVLKDGSIVSQFATESGRDPQKLASQYQAAVQPRGC